MRRRGHDGQKKKSKGDIVLALLFFFAILAVFAGHRIWSMERTEKVDERETYAAVFRQEAALHEREQALARAEIAVLAQAAQGNSASSSFAQWDEPFFEEDNKGEPFFADIDPPPATVTTKSTQSYIQFEDVTVTTLENKRLGFVMEIPSEWTLASEQSDGVILASSPFISGVSIEDIIAREGALWIAVRRPCVSQVGALTQFAFATTSAIATREATACIAPFLVTLGYRADAPDHFGRERFLLSVARTFYPIVSPHAPYAPIR